MLELIIILMFLNFALIWPLMTISLWHKVQNKTNSYTESLFYLAGSMTVSSGCCIAMIQGLYLITKKIM